MGRSNSAGDGIGAGPAQTLNVHMERQPTAPPNARALMAAWFMNIYLDWPVSAQRPRTESDSRSVGMSRRISALRYGNALARAAT